MKEDNNKIYDNFFEFWAERYSNHPEWVKEIALETWNICVDGYPLPDPVFCNTCGKEIVGFGFCSQECSEYETLD